jgi:hypothetical protein
MRSQCDGFEPVEYRLVSGETVSDGEGEDGIQPWSRSDRTMPAVTDCEELTRNLINSEDDSEAASGQRLNRI